MVPPQNPDVYKILIRDNGRSTGVAENRGTHWPDVYLFASTQKPGITLSASIFEDKCLLGVAWVIDIDLAALSKFLQGIVLKMGKRSAISVRGLMETYFSIGVCMSCRPPRVD